MTNKIAIALFVIVAGLFAADFWYQGGEGSVFLGKKFFELLEWIAFWR